MPTKFALVLVAIFASAIADTLVDRAVGVDYTSVSTVGKIIKTFVYKAGGGAILAVLCFA